MEEKNGRGLLQTQQTKTIWDPLLDIGFLKRVVTDTLVIIGENLNWNWILSDITELYFKCDVLN